MTPSSFPLDPKRTTTVAVWTPWGVQSVQKQDFRGAALKRLAGQLASGPKVQDANAPQG